MIAGEEQPGRWRRVGAEEADGRLLPAGRGRDVRAIRAGRGDRRQRAPRRPAPRARGTAARDVGSGASRRYGQDPRAFRRRAGGIRPPWRLRAREPHARSPPRTRLRRRADRRRRGRAVWRLEDAGGDGARSARPARCAADGRADQPPRHRVDPLARVVPQTAHGRAAHDVARSRVHEPRRLEDCRDRRRGDHVLLGQLRLLRARAGHPRGESRSGVLTAAGDAREGAAVHRSLCRARGQGGAGAEPREGARENREDRAAEEAARREVRLPAAAAVGRDRGDARARREGVRETDRPRGSVSDNPARRALVRDGEERRGQIDAAQDGRGRD